MSALLQATPIIGEGSACSRSRRAYRIRVRGTCCIPARYPSPLAIHRMGKEVVPSCSCFPPFDPNLNAVVFGYLLPSSATRTADRRHRRGRHPETLSRIAFNVFPDPGRPESMHARAVAGQGDYHGKLRQRGDRQQRQIARASVSTFRTEFQQAIRGLHPASRLRTPPEPNLLAAASPPCARFSLRQVLSLRKCPLEWVGQEMGRSAGGTGIACCWAKIRVLRSKVHAAAGRSSWLQPG